MPKTADTARPYEWDYDGEFTPDKGKGLIPFLTFSVGIFQWLPKKSGKGLKRSPVAKRIRGHVSDPDTVFAKAQAECDKRNALQARLDIDKE